MMQKTISARVSSTVPGTGRPERVGATVVGTVVGDLVVGVVVTATGVKTTRSRFWPSPMNRSLSEAVPAGRVSTVVVVVQASYEPVAGTGIVVTGLSLTRTSIAWAAVLHPATRNAARYWPVAATGPFGLIPFTLQGGQPTVLALPLPVGFTAFVATPGTPLNDIKVPAANGVGTCALSKSNPVCSSADLAKGANGIVLFGQRPCSASDVGCKTGTEVELAGDFGTLYSPNAPARVVLTCLNSKCLHAAPGATVTESEPFGKPYDYNYTCASGCAEDGDLYREREVEEDFRWHPVFVQLKGAPNFVEAHRCVPVYDLKTKGKITDPDALKAGFCVDVNAITRSGNSFTGDLIRPVLFVEDPKMR